MRFTELLEYVIYFYRFFQVLNAVRSSPYAIALIPVERMAPKSTGTLSASVCSSAHHTRSLLVI